MNYWEPQQKITSNYLLHKIKIYLIFKINQYKFLYKKFQIYQTFTRVISFISLKQKYQTISMSVDQIYQVQELGKVLMALQLLNQSNTSEFDQVVNVIKDKKLLENFKKLSKTINTLNELKNSHQNIQNYLKCIQKNESPNKFQGKVSYNIKGSIDEIVLKKQNLILLVYKQLLKLNNPNSMKIDSKTKLIEAIKIVMQTYQRQVLRIINIIQKQKKQLKDKGKQIPKEQRWSKSLIEDLQYNLSKENIKSLNSQKLIKLEQMNTSLKQQKAKIQEKYKMLFQQRRQIEKVINSYEEQNKKYKSSNAKLQLQSKQLKLNNKQLQSSNKRLQLQCKQLKLNNKQRQQSKVELIKVNKTQFQSKANQLQKTNQNFKKVKTIENIEEQMNNLKIENDSLTQTVKQLQQLTRQITEDYAKTYEQQKNFEVLKQKNNQLQSQNQINKQYSKKIQQRCEELIKQRNILQQQFNIFKKTSQSEILQFKNYNTILKARLKQKNLLLLKLTKTQGQMQQIKQNLLKQKDKVAQDNQQNLMSETVDIKLKEKFQQNQHEKKNIEIVQFQKVQQTENQINNEKLKQQNRIISQNNLQLINQNEKLKLEHKQKLIIVQNQNKAQYEALIQQIQLLKINKMKLEQQINSVNQKNQEIKIKLQTIRQSNLQKQHLLVEQKHIKNQQEDKINQVYQFIISNFPKHLQQTSEQQLTLKVIQAIKNIKIKFDDYSLLSQKLLSEKQQMQNKITSLNIQQNKINSLNQTLESLKQKQFQITQIKMKQKDINRQIVEQKQKNIKLNQQLLLIQVQFQKSKKQLQRLKISQSNQQYSKIMFKISNFIQQHFKKQIKKSKVQQIKNIENILKILGYVKDQIDDSNSIFQQIDILNLQKNTSKRQLDSKQQQIKQLKEELSSMQISLQQKRSEILINKIDYENLTKELNNIIILKNNNTQQLQQKIKKLSEETKQIEGLKVIIRQKEQKINKLLQQLQTPIILKQFAQLYTQTEIEVLSKDLQAEKKLEDQIQQLKTKLKNTNEQHNQQIQKLNTKYSQLQDKVDLLNEQINSNQCQFNKVIEQKEAKINQAKVQIQSYSAQIHHKGYLSRYFGCSNVLSFDSPQKKFIIEEIQSQLQKQIFKTQLVYRYDPLNGINFHEYIDEKINVVLIVSTERGSIIGGFMQGPINPNSRGGFGFLFNATTKQTHGMNLKNSNSRVLTYDEYYFIFGNSELRLKTGDSKKVLFSNFGIISNYFETNGKNVKNFLGEPKSEQIQRQAKYITYEIYTLKFNI